ncbi:hypothetical protein RFI_17704 [Reticulomyxa filosa]|uniref:Viral A-type inclusion protein n=1 Tax=Reticulomyxa filosa TaxID=46433 RepID=X6N2J0_RETFI|nr:hypothetical protein RFI_17704 [Reticulomyxa filosa]|eukprot:ETO19527.1 hypothetical protein RFI_17704 [Reticulomyxa filosa]
MVNTQEANIITTNKKIIEFLKKSQQDIAQKKVKIETLETNFESEKILLQKLLEEKNSENMTLKEMITNLQSSNFSEPTIEQDKALISNEETNIFELSLCQNQIKNLKCRNTIEELRTKNAKMEAIIETIEKYFNNSSDIKSNATKRSLSSIEADITQSEEDQDLNISQLIQKKNKKMVINEE